MSYRVTGRGEPRTHDHAEAAVLDALWRTGEMVNVINGYLWCLEDDTWNVVCSLAEFRDAIIGGPPFEGVTVVRLDS